MLCCATLCCAVLCCVEYCAECCAVCCVLCAALFCAVLCCVIPTVQLFRAAKQARDPVDEYKIPAMVRVYMGQLLLSLVEQHGGVHGMLLFSDFTRLLMDKGLTVKVGRLV